MNDIIQQIKIAYDNRYAQSLTINLIAEYIDILYTPFKRTFENVEDYIKYRESLFDDDVLIPESGKNILNKVIIIPQISKSNLNNYEAYLILEDKRELLIRVRSYQIEMFSEKTNRDGGLKKFNEYKEKIDLLFNKVLDIEKNNKSNPFPRIFSTVRAFKLFKTMQGKVNNNIADYSFIYRVMKRDGFIINEVKNKDYILFLSKEYDIDLGDKVKLLADCSPKHKIDFYESIVNINS